MHKILRALILSDMFILSSFGLIEPIFAVYILSKINGATISSIGVAVAIQLFTKAIFQIMIGRWTDIEKGNKRELHCLLVGSLIMSIVPAGFIFARTIGAVYCLQFLYGLGAAFVYPGWMVVFSRYTREDRAGYEWGVYNTITSLGSALTAFLGAYVVEYYSFNNLFIAVTVLSLVGTTFIVHVFRHEFTKGWAGHAQKS